jgi:hypothetical protein
MLDEETEARAHALATEAKGRRVKGRRKRAAPTRKRMRAWWMSTTATAGGGVVAAPAPTGPTPPSEDAEESPALSLDQWLDAM